jgi:hypothetical protein
MPLLGWSKAMNEVERFILASFPDGKNIVLIILSFAVLALVRKLVPQLRDILRDRLIYSLAKQQLQMERDAMAGEDYFRRQNFELQKAREVSEAHLRRQEAREESQGELYLAWSSDQRMPRPARRRRNGRNAEGAPPEQA